MRRWKDTFIDRRLTVRAATNDDLAAVQRIADETWRATYSGQIADIDIDAFLESAYSDRSLMAAVSRLGIGFIVAELGEDVVGYAMAGLNHEGEPELYAIYVLPAHHGTGAGQILWNAARAALVAQGQPRMCCWVLVSNARARRFYEREGAILTDERDFQVGATTIREARYCVTLGG